MPGNPHEDFNRAEKTRKLCDAFVEHSREALRGKFIPGKVPEAVVIAIMAKEAKQDLWELIAKQHGIRTPSARTVKGCVLLLEHRAKLALPADPLEGLPR